jgi:hypothetical protein
VRYHLDEPIIALMRKPEGEDLRKMVLSLFDELRPGWATAVEGYENRYEFLASGYWVQYEIDDQSEMETIIRVVFAE